MGSGLLQTHLARCHGALVLVYWAHRFLASRPRWRTNGPTTSNATVTNTYLTIEESTLKFVARIKKNAWLTSAKWTATPFTRLLMKH